MNLPVRARWLALGIAAAVVVAGLSIALAAVLLRPAPAARAPAPTPSPAATPRPTPSAPAAPEAQQHQQYRAYVSTVVKGGTSVITSTAGLAGCRFGRHECVARLDEASAQVAALRSDLAANPAPPCLESADQHLQDALSFQQNGFDIARDAVRSENRARMVQGLVLAGVGLWRASQAIVAGHQSNC